MTWQTQSRGRSQTMASPNSKLPSPSELWRSPQEGLDEGMLLACAIVPLLCLVHRLLLGRQACAPPANRRALVGEEKLPSDAIEFDELMARFRAADPDRRGLTVATLHTLVGAQGRDALQREWGSKPANARVSVVDFVPLACKLSASPTRPSKPKEAAFSNISAAAAPTSADQLRDTRAPRSALAVSAEAEPEPVDVHEFARWLAGEHRRCLNVMLLSHSCEAPHTSTAATASAIVAAEQAERDVYVAGAISSSNVELAGAPSAAPISADGVHLCLQLLQSLRELALSGDLIGVGGVAVGASGTEPELSVSSAAKIFCAAAPKPRSSHT